MDESGKFGERKVHVVEMKVNDVELSDAVQHFLKHHKMMRKLVDTLVVIEAQRFRAAWHQVCRCFGVSARKQCYFVSILNERLGQIRNNPLGAAVKLWRNAFVERRYLGYPQKSSSP